MTIAFVLLTADQPSEYAEFQKALAQVRDTMPANGAVAIAPTDQVSLPTVPPVAATSPVAQPNVPNPMADLAAMVPQVAAPVAAQGEQRRGKRTDGLGMIGHKSTCTCPACGSIKTQLSTMFGQPITSVPDAGTPEANSWGAALAAAMGKPAPVADPTTAPPTSVQAPPAPVTQGAVNPMAQLAQQAAPVAAPAAQQAMPQMISDYPTSVYQVVLQWGLTLVDPTKQNALLAFLQGNAPLDSLQGIGHRKGTLYDVVVGKIRSALKG